MGKTLGRGIMKHCILVKWNSLVSDKKAMLPEIFIIFGKLLVLPGIHDVKLHENVVDRSNRYDLMICIDMDKDFLPVYDESEPHHEWKQKFGKFLENKAIFDFEE